MKYRQRNAKRDANEKDIVAALRKIGASVAYHSGTNEPDLFVGYQGKNYLLEVKSDQGKLKPGQMKWHEEWRGQCCAVRTPEQAINIITESYGD